MPFPKKMIGGPGKGRYAEVSDNFEQAEWIKVDGREHGVSEVIVFQGERVIQNQI